MKNIKYIVLVLCCCLTFSNINAQLATNALRYAQIQLGGGTARTMGVGGGLGALGADFSVLSTNPAGLASFRSSEFTISPAYFTTTTSSTLVGTGNIASSTDATKFHLNNWGFVFAYRPKNGKGDWKTFNLGFGVNRFGNNDQEFSYSGDSKGSIVQSFTELAQNKTIAQLNPFGTSLALETGAIYNPKNETTVYTNDFQGANADNNVRKSQIVVNTGKMQEFVVSLAGNYKEKVQIGATIAFPKSEATTQSIYSESDFIGKNPAFNSLSFRDSLSAVTSNFRSLTAKLGAIYKVSNKLRIGLALHSPTTWTVEEAYINSLTYEYTENGKNYKTPSTSPDGSYNYKVVSPARVIGSIGYVAGKSGFLSADIEYIDYTKTQFKFADIDSKSYENQLNAEIKSTFKPAVNVRLGGELAFGVLRLRGGLGLYSAALLNDKTVSKVYSGGIGFREDNFFVDFAAQVGKSRTGYAPYSVVNAPVQQVNNDVSNIQYVMTFGFKF